MPTTVQQVRDVPTLHALGASSAGAPSYMVASLGDIDASAPLPNRPTTDDIPDGPALFEVEISGPLAAPVVIGMPLAPDGGGFGGYQSGDVIRVIRTDVASAQSVTFLQGYAGPPILGAVLPQPPNSAALELQLLETGGPSPAPINIRWHFLGGGAL